MLRFISSLKQKLLSENRFNKYLIYAVGEIVLVVIGILIAVSINNWNIEKQDRETEQMNLLALKNEFIQNLKILDAVMERNRLNIERATKMIESFKSNVSDTISEETIARNAYQTFGNEINNTANSGVLTEIISTGDLKLIQNQELNLSSRHSTAG
ncbi:MAG: hypothetical protein KDC49_18645 [Saprospiraceae bacterium]|nr:hypothetical protein [Saprospiraceae bacterium]